MADGPFIQYPKWLREFLRGDAVTNDILLELLAYMDGRTQRLTTSYGHIAEKTGYHKTTVIRSVNKLTDLGVLVKKTRTKNGRQLTNEFYVNFNNPKYLTVGVAGALPSPLGVAGGLPGGSRGATPGGSGGATQTRITNKNKKPRRGKLEKIDPRLGS